MTIRRKLSQPQTTALEQIVAEEEKTFIDGYRPILALHKAGLARRIHASSMGYSTWVATALGIEWLAIRAQREASRAKPPTAKALRAIAARKSRGTK